jgi:hypothetical protein
MICSLPVALALARDVLHVPGREELALLDVDRLAGTGHLLDEIGLATEEGRRLQHVDHAGHFVHRRVFVHVGEHRHADLALDFVQNLQTRFQARSAEAGTRGAIGLVEAGLEDEGNTEPPVISLSVPAVSNCNCMDSITQGRQSGRAA